MFNAKIKDNPKLLKRPIVDKKEAQAAKEAAPNKEKEEKEAQAAKEAAAKKEKDKKEAQAAKEAAANKEKEAENAHQCMSTNIKFMSSTPVKGSDHSDSGVEMNAQVNFTITNYPK